MARKKPATEQLQAIIEDAFERRATLTAMEIEGSTRPAVDEAIELLESGKARVAAPHGKQWEVNEWLKKAVLLYFRINDMQMMEGFPAPYWDKVRLRFDNFDDADFQKLGARVVPGAIVRSGAHIGKDVVLMPSFVNIGAHVGEGTMVDTWATVGSCAQIGRNVHISGGAGIGGVLEPLQAGPVIIEDRRRESSSQSRSLNRAACADGGTRVSVSLPKVRLLTKGERLRMGVRCSIFRPGGRHGA